MVAPNRISLHGTFIRLLPDLPAEASAEASCVSLVAVPVGEGSSMTDDAGMRRVGVFMRQTHIKIGLLKCFGG